MKVYEQSKLWNGKQTHYCQWIKGSFLLFETNKSAGYDDISYNYVKNCFGELCDPLLHIFNLSSSSGIFSHSLKIGKVSPIYKASDSSDLSNYRPISVLPCFSKILERILLHSSI